MKCLNMLFLLLLFVFVVEAQENTATVVEENFAFIEPQDRQRFLRLTAELRCPMCQNQNIADSDAMIARDMRRKVYQLLQQGMTDEEVIAFMKERYGDFVSYSPPVNIATVWLWLAPVVFLFLALVRFFWHRHHAVEMINDNDLAQADALLNQEESK